jgi:DNA-binding SARP family transcriptional activator/tetratricopeptide (TPR) repeat protein
MQRALLALLLVQAGQPVPLHEIVDVLWGEEPPGTAVNVVQRHVGGLRRLFEPDLPARGRSRFVIRGSGGYRLDVDRGTVDLFRFRGLRQEAARLAEKGRPGEASVVLLEALGLWQGLVASGIPAEIRGHRFFASVDSEQLTAVKLAADHALAADEPEFAGPVLTMLRRFAGQYPLDEVLQARLMLLLAATGGKAEALAVFRSVRELLAGELGLDPGPELRAAQQQVLREPEPPAPIAAEPVAAGRLAAGPENPRPAQLPVDLPVFVGRRHELDLFRTLPPATMITAIGGMAGVGKTALAVHWAHEVAPHFPDGQLYVDLRGFHPSGEITSSAEALRSFLDALGVPAHRVPASLDAQASLFRSLLADRRVVVVLDNARDSEHVRPLLPGSPGSLAVVTSRHQLYDLVAAYGATAVTLDLLPHADALDFLARRLGADRIALEPDAAAEIVELSGRLPLILAIVSARVAMNPGFSLQAIAEELRAGHGSLDAFTGEAPRSDARSVFSWSYRTLSPGAARLFRLMALHPGPCCSLPAAAALSRQPGAQLRPLLTELLRAHLIYETVPGRYGCYELLRAYGAELAQQEEFAADSASARERLFDHYLHSAHSAAVVLAPSREQVALGLPAEGADPVVFTDAAEAVRWLDRERPVLIAAVEQDARHGSGRHGWQLATVLWQYLDRNGCWPLQLGVQTAAVMAAEHTGDPHAQAYANRSLGFADGRLGQWAEADRRLRAALGFFGRVGDLNGLAGTHRLIAFLANRRGRHQEALDRYRSASGLYRTIGSISGQSGSLSGLAGVHNEVGWTYILLGDHAQALEECRLAIEGHQAIGDRNGEAAAWDSLGYAQHHLGAWEHALASFGHALALYREICDRYLEADTLVHIGDTQRAAGRDPEAIAAWCRALGILEEIGHSDAESVREKLRPLTPEPTAASDFRHCFG